VDVVAGTNRFHERLARASGNKAIALLVGILQSISDDAYSVILASDTSTPHDVLQKNMKKTLAGYKALCELLEKGKTEEAAIFWRRYMERALEFLKHSKLGDRRIVHTSAGNRTSVTDNSDR
jgi:DNA-binding FadR family transcriptional regulator